MLSVLPANKASASRTKRAVEKVQVPSVKKDPDPGLGQRFIEALSPGPGKNPLAIFLQAFEDNGTTDISAEYLAHIRDDATLIYKLACHMNMQPDKLAGRIDELIETISPGFLREEAGRKYYDKMAAIRLAKMPPDLPCRQTKEPHRKTKDLPRKQCVDVVSALGYGNSKHLEHIELGDIPKIDFVPNYILTIIEAARGGQIRDTSKDAIAYQVGLNPAIREAILKRPEDIIWIRGHKEHKFAEALLQDENIRRLVEHADTASKADDAQTT